MSKKEHDFHILLVEDDDLDAFLVKKYLDKVSPHFQQHRVVNGEEALEFLSKRKDFHGVPRPDLIILDLKMPRMDGREFLNSFKLVPEYHDIPIIVLSGEDFDAKHIPGYNLHENTYIRKWVQMKDFAALVSAVRDVWEGAGIPS